MKRVFLAVLKVFGLSLLGLTLVYVIWQPVIPSGIIIEKMAEMVDPGNLPDDKQIVIRYDLSGRGGGMYNLVVNKNGVEVVEGETGQVDLVLFMEAKDFNDLMFSLARGKADESMFIRLTLSKVLRFAGDMSIFELIFKNEEVGG